MAKADSAGAGRPPKYDKKFHPEDFIRQSKNGKSKTVIACSWDISRETLYEWTRSHKEFSDAVKKGTGYLHAWWEELGTKAMLNQVTVNGVKTKADLGYFCWMSKNILKWSDRPAPDQEENDLDLSFTKDEK